MNSFKNPILNVLYNPDGYSIFFYTHAATHFGSINLPFRAKARNSRRPSKPTRNDVIAARWLACLTIVTIWFADTAASLATTFLSLATLRAYS